MTSLESSLLKNNVFSQGLGNSSIPLFQYWFLTNVELLSLRYFTINKVWSIENELTKPETKIFSSLSTAIECVLKLSFTSINIDSLSEDVGTLPSQL